MMSSLCSGRPGASLPQHLQQYAAHAGRLPAGTGTVLVPRTHNRECDIIRGSDRNRTVVTITAALTIFATDTVAVSVMRSRHVHHDSVL